MLLKGYGGANAHLIMEDSASWVPAVSSQTRHLGGHSNGHSNGLSNGHVNGHSNGLSNGYANGPSNEDSSGQLVGHGANSRYVKMDEAAELISDNKVLVLSGKDEQACQKMVSNLQDFLEQSKSAKLDPQKFFDSLIYTLGQRRTRFPWVSAHPVSITEGIDGLIEALQTPKFRPSRSSRPPRIGMVFTGQGAQWHAMGRELVDAYPIYKASLEEAENYMKEFGAEWSILEELSRDADVSRINEVALSTPICVALQISLVRLLRAWGIVPVAVTSHSSGEMAAAYAAGAMSYRTAMAFSYYRAVLAADRKYRGPVKGGMIAVGLGLEETESYLQRLTSESKAVVACINSPSSITVAGDLPAIMELEELATADGVFARRLKVDTAWHSHQMATLASVYMDALERMGVEDHGSDAFNQVAFSSPVTGGRMTNAKDISHPKHWVKSLVQPVQFVSAFTDMILGETGTSTSNVDVIIEVGPHTALGGPIQQILSLREFKDLEIPYHGCLVRKTDARDSMQTLASSLLQEGYPVNMEAVNFAHGKGQYVKVLTELPSYPWNHQVKHWVEPRFNKALRER